MNFHILISEWVKRHTQKALDIPPLDGSCGKTRCVAGHLTVVVARLLRRPGRISRNNTMPSVITNLTRHQDGHWPKVQWQPDTISARLA